ncbi:alpha/beta hydrolase family protein [Kordiimonas pumila]|uniref:Alpha/beta hydrolase family protein n=1 Tax=Kordiimonas pumila TaxID=2161677 RepID=A0ABV7D3J7_9PROT|nr:prolyl oligopeptidase family serine peptidase [Kordiimonas pumila]
MASTARHIDAADRHRIAARVDMRESFAQTDEVVVSGIVDRIGTSDAPPFFILHAEDDDVVPVENALLLRAALKAQNIRVETHLFTNGGHGFGLRKAVGKPVGEWLDLFLNWAQTTGFANLY